MSQQSNSSHNDDYKHRSHSTHSSSHSSHSSSGHHHSTHHHRHHHSSSHHHSHHSSSHHHGSHNAKSNSHSSRSNGYYYNSEEHPLSSQEAQEKIKNLSEKYQLISQENEIGNTKTIHSHSKHKKKKSKIGKIFLGIFLFFIALCIVAASTLLIMINSGKNNLLNYDDTQIEAVDDAEVEPDGKTVKYNGKIYRLNEKITSIACLGIDEKNLLQNATIGTAGQADTILIIAFDTESGVAKLLSVPRDTIAAIDVYDTQGSFAKVEQTQICLAYAYGDGSKTSCENVVSALQKMMYGIPIKSYASLDLKGIEALNDAVGGVTVTPNESFSDFTAGKTVKLWGSMATSFVRYRDHKNVDANLHRMERQMQYIKAFSRSAINTIGSDFGKISQIYNTATDYSYTNIALSDATYLASTFITKANGQFETFTVPGKMVVGDDEYSEYYIDETPFYETLLSIYYNEVGTY